VGAAILGSAQKGEAAIDHAVTGFIELLADVAAFSPDRLWRAER
jgi:creatinine amidohydrolase/Fe(II)-dependent formamide hydrolase-like protein